MVNKANQVVHHAVRANTTVSKDKLPNLVANHVVLERTTVNKDKLLNLVAHHVVLENTTVNKEDHHLAKTAKWGITRNVKHLHSVLHVQQQRLELKRVHSMPVIARNVRPQDNARMVNAKQGSPWKVGAPLAFLESTTETILVLFIVSGLQRKRT
jgi:hypothetical protein